MLKRDKEKYKAYQHEYYLRRKQRRDYLEQHYHNTNNDIMAFSKQILKLLIASDDKKQYEKTFDKFIVINGEPNNQWNDTQTLEWYKKLVLHLLSF